MNLRRVLAAGLVSALAATSCAGNGGETDTAATPTVATVAGGSAGVGGGQAGNAEGGGTTASTTTTAPSPKVPPTTASTTARLPATVATLPPDAGTVVPEESNCRPGPGALPDGLYFGFAVAGSADALQFDLACWFTGEPAIRAAAEDGEPSPPANDYWIRNENLTERTVVVSYLHLPVLWLYNQGSPDSELIAYSDWLVERATGTTPPIWVTVDGGQLTSIVEQYLP